MSRPPLARHRSVFGPHRLGYLSLLAALALVSGGCRRPAPDASPRPGGGDAAAASTPAGKAPPATPAPKFAVDAVDTAEGVATWYDVPADSLAARRAWNTEFTAAHNRWPIGDYVRVTSLENGKTVIARVTDRGIPKGRALIDLSRPAAEALDMVSAGEMRVRVERLAVSASTEKAVSESRENPQPTAPLDNAATREDEQRAAER